MGTGFTRLWIQSTDGLIERYETLHVSKQPGIVEQLGDFQLVNVVPILAKQLQCGLF